jgi:hypothetical protein
MMNHKIRKDWAGHTYCVSVIHKHEIETACFSYEELDGKEEITIEELHDRVELQFKQAKSKKRKQRPLDKDEAINFLKKHKKILVGDMIMKLGSGYTDKIIKEIDERNMFEEFAHNYMYSWASAQKDWYKSNYPSIIKQLLKEKRLKWYKDDKKRVWYEFIK